MDIYKIYDIKELIKDNPYVGRGIIIGMPEDGKNAVAAYFIMGRSANSRNRVFVEKDGSLFTAPFDESKVEDPSLIIYEAVKKHENKLIITNGDHTNTIYEGIKNGKSFKEALESRQFEPDAPNFTPRISGVLEFKENGFSYEMSILKSADAAGTICSRYTFSYLPQKGLGHFIHTYACDGNPLPCFVGEPERVAVSGSIDGFASALWEALDHDNRISLYVRYTDLENGREESRIINRNTTENGDRNERI